MTQYLNKTFTVGMPSGQAYRDNWDTIFGPKKKAEPVKERPVLTEDEKRIAEQRQRAMDEVCQAW